jgi:phosphoinositide-3-kinase, regulatory subunit 4
LAFQLLCAVRDCHAQNVYHGDIKTENILVTSWNWLYLSDFSSSFKPTYLPEDNPADFSFYFDTSGRRTCYVAPERFLSAGAPAEGNDKVNWAMDIFSVGCVIAELFLETPIFSLSQIFKYRQGEYDPHLAHLSKIQDPDVRELVAHMIQRDPESRYAAEEYLNFWRRKTFPDYFYTFLHQYMYTMTDPTSGQKPITGAGDNLGESDERIEKIYNDFDKIAYFLGPEGGGTERNIEKDPSPPPTRSLFPLQIDIPNYKHQAFSGSSKTGDDGSLIFLGVVLSSLRSTARAAAKIRACELLLAFTEQATDEAKLDRVLPYIITLLNDKTDLVRVTALRTLTQLVRTHPTLTVQTALTYLGCFRLHRVAHQRLYLPRIYPTPFTTIHHQSRPEDAAKPDCARHSCCLSSVAIFERVANSGLDSSSARRRITPYE